ncbi:MAG: class I SAM-dependent methyltransferase [Rhodospirillales bacterium]|nr:class I SAM-dependent methyltransferase [Rhodospirillales bacterium]
MAILDSVPYEQISPAPTSARGPATPVHLPQQVNVPRYLRDVYTWAYLNPRNVRLLDREWVVAAILWGQHQRLQDAAFAEIEPGQTVLLPASVYGDIVPAMARHIGSEGRFDVIDVTAVQVARCRQKLRAYPWATARRGDARNPGDTYDTICCYFLMHEIPDPEKHAVVNALLGSVQPGGKVVFVDYHKPHWAHPLKWWTALVFTTLEPFAISLWKNDIRDFASHPDSFQWRTETYFGGLFQKTVAERAAVTF